MNESKLSEVLYEIDPINTCCKENEAEDEYDLFALDVHAEYLNNEISFRATLAKCFKEYFDEEVDIETLDEIMNHFNK